MNSLYNHVFKSPWGMLELRANDSQLLAAGFIQTTPTQLRPNAITELAAQQLSEYCAGQRTQFDLPLGAQGTAFQQAVWQQLQAIPYGQTCSYRDIANAIARPKAVRAVGAANGRNPLTIIVPCHRVIGANGSLTGYAWGMAIKSALLRHEQQ